MTFPEQPIPSTFFYRLRNLLLKVWPAFKDIFGSQVYVLASAIAFNAMLSFLPFTILVLSFCKEALHWPQGYQATLQLIAEYLPTGQDFIIRNIKAMLQARRQAPVLSMGLLIFTSMGILLPVELALNRAWGVEKNRSFLKNQLTSFLLVLTCGGLTVAAAAVIVTLKPILLSPAVGASREVALVLDRTLVKLTAFVLALSIIALIYYVLPNRKVTLAEVLPAAVFSGALWEIARYLFVACLPSLHFQRSYGPFTITVTLIVGAYISSLILLLGANLTAQNILPPLYRKTKDDKMTEPQ
ncbi:MAG: YihY/virulence factor BrkB family protein [Acidobacteria bacterium]|nr:YihY/virulence factor BrkB family protein [Acidobacteriota bacterium]MBI3657893.1 YihY/virulence factor BrkB family protein [Acidobacteriota bacterium]